MYAIRSYYDRGRSHFGACSQTTADHGRCQQVAGDGPEPHHLAHARLAAAFGGAPQGIHFLHAFGGHLVHLHIGLNAGAAGTQSDNHALGTVSYNFV